jgi:hypothetical protein
MLDKILYAVDNSEISQQLQQSVLSPFSKIGTIIGSGLRKISVPIMTVANQIWLTIKLL